MPTTPLKNKIYQAGIQVVRPYYRYHRRFATSLSDSDAFYAITDRHCIVSGCAQRFDKDCKSNIYTVSRPWADCSDSTYFRAASISKMAVSLAYMRLTDQGLDLRTPVNSLLAISFVHDITLFQLLSHTSGILDGPGYGQAVSARMPLDQLLAKPDFQIPPGNFHYSNLGFGLLEACLEVLTGQSFIQAMEGLVFAPLKIQCGYDPAIFPKGTALSPCWRVLPPSKTPVYVAKASPISFGDSSILTHYALSPGNLWITTPQMIRIMHMLAKGGEGFLTEKTIATMQTPYSAYGTLDHRLSYGLGLLIIHDASLSPNPIYGHQGFAYGAVQGAFYDPIKQSGVAILNSGGDESRTGRLGNINASLIAWGFSPITKEGDKYK